MTLAEDFPHGVFSVRLPAEQLAPFVFNSPHSGRVYPARFLQMSRLDRVTIRRSEDSFVEELFGAAPSLGAPLLFAHFPRAFLDVNREPFELDPKMFRETLPPQANVRSARVAGGLGTVPKVVGEGQEIYAGRISLAEAVGRIDNIYRPYHQELDRLLAETKSLFGSAVLVDCHSMPASIRVGDHGMRPDFIVGDRFGASAKRPLSEAALGLLAGMGYTVAHNRPYAGGFITEHYGRPAEGIQAIQIEINRGLYLNERTLQKTAGFEPLFQDLTRFCANLIALWEEWNWTPLAAE
ncbi:N-formylglutamate amidohydrolase [Tianweitania sediminis]|uniref:N-formylglutamate amidohydrolase n=1 Tax=Tianweitania sediminis TaxID=1502156 RepID=A0A8J7R1U4_9HYPH|nr:N-formylglutamate amidohydrolase [Tianweitania sediminis]